MPVNFNALQMANPAAAFFQGQQDVARNALMQEKAAMEREQNALRRRQITGQIEGAEEDRRRQVRVEKTAAFRDQLIRAATPEEARNLVRMQFADPDIGQVLSQTGTLEQALRAVPDDPTGFETYRQQQAMGMGEWMKSQMPKVVGNAVYLPGERRFVAAPSQRLVSVIGPDGQPTMVPADQAAGMTPLTAATAKMAGIGAAPARAGGAGEGAAPAEKPLTPAQSAKRRDQLGKEFKAAQNALQTTQDVLDSISFVKNEPGLSRATGFTGTLLPSFPEGAAASAETRLKNFEGKVTALGKAQAAATGAIGSIANQEWKILADQIAAIDRSKGTKPLLDQLDLVELQAQGAMERIRDAYQRQFGEDFERFPQFADLPTPKSSFKPKAPAGGGARNAPAGTGGGLTAAEQAELEQLRARFGKK